MVDLVEVMVLEEEMEGLEEMVEEVEMAGVAARGLWEELEELVVLEELEETVLMLTVPGTDQRVVMEALEDNVEMEVDREAGKGKVQEPRRQRNPSSQERRW